MTPSQPRSRRRDTTADSHRRRKAHRIPRLERLEDRTLLSLTPTTTTLSYPGSNYYGRAETFTATVAPTAPGGGAPTGTMTFYEGAAYPYTLTPLATANLVVSGGDATATFTTSGLLAGSYKFRPVTDAGAYDFVALYNGDANYAPSDSRDVTTVAGSAVTPGYGGDGGPAAAASLYDPTGLATDASGDVFITDTLNQVVREMIPGPQGYADATIIRVAGTPNVLGYSGDGGPATSAVLFNPQAITVDHAGDLFIADTGNNVIREVIPGPNAYTDATITTIAGTGVAGYNGDNQPAATAQINSPSGVALDASGNLYFTERYGFRVRELTLGPHGYADATITTIAGNGSFGTSGDNGPAAAASLKWPRGITLDAQGDVFVAEYDDIREIHGGLIRTVAGAPSNNSSITGVALDANGDLLFARQGWDFLTGYDLRLISWGDGSAVPTSGSSLIIVGTDNNGLLHIRIFDPSGKKVTDTDETQLPATQAGAVSTLKAQLPGLLPPHVLTFGEKFELLGEARSIVDQPSLGYRDSEIFLVPAQWLAWDSGGPHAALPFAGTEVDGDSADDVPAIQAQFHHPNGLAFDAQGNLLVADAGNNCIREIAGPVSPPLIVSPDPVVLTFGISTATQYMGLPVTLSVTATRVGPGADMSLGPSADTRATVHYIDVDPHFNVDVPLVTSGGVGTATVTYTNLTQGNHFFSAQISYDPDFTVSWSGPATGGVRILLRPTTTTLSVDTTDPVAGLPMTVHATVATPPAAGLATGTVTFYDGVTPLGTVPLAPSGSAATATLTTPAPAAGSHLIRAVYNNPPQFIGSSSMDGRVTTVAQPDSYAIGVAVDAAGDAFFADPMNQRVGEVHADGTITTYATGFHCPEALAIDPSGNLFVADFGADAVVKVRPDSTRTTVFTPVGLNVNIAEISLATDTSGDLFVSYAVPDSTFSSETVNIVEVRPDGTSTFLVVIPNETPGAPPPSLAVDGAGSLYAYFPYENRTYKVLADGSLAPVPLNPPGGYGFNSPGIASDATGDLYFPDLTEVDPSGTASNLAPGYGGFAVAIDGAGHLYAAGGTSLLRIDLSPNVAVRGMESSDLQSFLNSPSQGGSATLQPTSNAVVSNVVQAINGLASPPAGTTETITLDLGGGTFTTDTHIQAQPGVTVVITNGTLIGGSPALIVDSGNVVLRGVTARNATNAPTILVQGGTLTVRSSTINESTGYAQAAIAITGGTVDLGTAADPGQNVISTNGLGSFIRNATASLVPVVGVTFQADGIALPAAPPLLMSLTASANPAILDQPVSFTATVRADVPGAGVPSGSIDFLDGTTNTDLGTVPLTNGAATLANVVFTVGDHSVVARYVGGPGYLPGLDAITESVRYKFGGFLAPLNTGIALALGRTVPVKFQLTDYAGASITTTAAITSLKIAPVRPDGSYGYDFAPVSGDAVGLRYDPTSKQFNFNWATKGLGAGKYAILLALADGTTKAQVVQLKAAGNSSGLMVDSSGASTAGTAGALLGGNLTLSVNDPNGLFTPDERARIADAIAAVDATIAPYGVSITQVGDGDSTANITVDTSSTSAVGGYADGVLGCETDAGEITLIQGWTWYAGSDSSAIGSGQYDFETVVIHELGHALGLGHSTNPASVMYATLAAGTADRVLSTADLNVPDSDGGGACGLHAAPAPGAATGPAPSARGMGPVATPGAGSVAVPLAAAVGIAPVGPGSGHHHARPRAARVRHAGRTPLADGTASRIRVRPRAAALDRRAVDALLDDIGLTWLTGDDGMPPLKKGRDRSVEKAIRDR